MICKENDAFGVNLISKVTRLNAQIGSHRTAIKRRRKRLCEYYLQKHAAGQKLDEVTAALCVEIVECEAAIRWLLDEVGALQEREDLLQYAHAAGSATLLQPETSVSQSEPLPEPKPDEPEHGKQVFCVCPNCGTGNPEGTRFCRECGSSRLPIAQTAPPPSAVSVAHLCPLCMTANERGDKFCKECGAKLDMDAPQPPVIPAVPMETPPAVCGRCGVPNAPFAKFCGECGEKMP